MLGSIDLGSIKEASTKSPNLAAPILWYQRYIDQDRLFAHCAKRGIETYLKLGDRREPRDEDDRIRRLIAKKEAAEGFPNINAHHTANLWNMLDVTLSDMLALIFVCKPEALGLPALKKVSFSVAEYEGLSKPQRMKITVAELKRELIRKGSIKLKNGVEVYEQIYRDMGISDDPLKNDRKILSELRAVRNVIVHNMAIADDRFVEQCPWLQITRGQEIKVTDSQYATYFQSASLYLISTFSRLMAKFPDAAPI